MTLTSLHFLLWCYCKTLIYKGTYIRYHESD